MRDPHHCRAVVGAFALLVAGCSVTPRAPAPPDPVRASRNAHEARMIGAWQDLTLQQLLHAKGPPRLLLDIPGGGNPPGFVMVYPRDPATGCLDTFALTFGPESKVRSYQCR